MYLNSNNRAHTVTLSGAAALPLKTNFMGTASYGFRLQDASFLPFTINSCYGSGPKPASCADANLTPLPTISRNSLSGDLRPLMVNATLVNNFFEGVTLKSFYRYYGLSNHSSQVELPRGFIKPDTGAPRGRASRCAIRMRRIASASRGAIISPVGCRLSGATVTTDGTGIIARPSTRMNMAWDRHSISSRRPTFCLGSLI